MMGSATNTDCQKLPIQHGNCCKSASYKRLKRISPILLALIFSIASFVCVAIREREEAWAIKGEREFDGISLFAALVAAFLGGITGIAIGVFLDALIFSRRPANDIH